MRDFWKKKWFFPTLLIVGILVVDQFVKIMVKTGMYIGQEIPVFGNWFILNFVENPGFAFGMSFGGETGKVVLTLFRIFAIGGIVWYLNKLLKEDTPKAVRVAMILILAGAIGNLIDSCFYGLLFSKSTYEIATFLPEAGGYAPLFQGKVVDMFYFPIIQTHFPQSFPFFGGKEIVFFRPVFNIADAAITSGVLLLVGHSFLGSKESHFSFFQRKKNSEE